ncbi:MAG: PAS domain-containing protein [Chloroflexaceae bacterium]|nr:PAS domain-containing protein [Chloroflexaceae bacterium]
MTEEGLQRENERLQRLITELEQRCTELQDKLALFQYTIDALPQTLFWKDCDLIYRGCSQRFADFAGCASPEELAGKTDYDLAWKPEESEAFQADDREVLKTARPKYHIMETQRHADGTETWVETSKAPIRAPMVRSSVW